VFEKTCKKEIMNPQDNLLLPNLPLDCIELPQFSSALVLIPEGIIYPKPHYPAQKLCKNITVYLSTYMLANCLQPDLQCRPQKEGAETEQFWELLGVKTEYSSQKIVREAENDPHLFSCNFSEGKDQFLVSWVVLFDIHPPTPISSSRQIVTDLFMMVSFPA
jgi:hypothetical protein